MAGELGSVRARYVDLEAVPSVWTAPAGRKRLWINSLDNDNVYFTDEAGSQTQVTDGGAVATGNAQYLWDYFVNGSGVTIPEFSAVRLITSGPDDGKLALSDSDEINEDSFLGLTFGGSIAAGATGKVIYNGKVPGAVTSLGLPSMTIIYMSNTPGQITSTAPSPFTDTVFQIGFTKGDDLYLRPTVRSEF